MFRKSTPLFVCMLSAALVFVSCDKDKIADLEDRDPVENTDTTSTGGGDGSDTTVTNPPTDAPRASFINLAIDLDLNNLIIKINGKQLLGDFDINEVTQFIALDGQDNVVVEIIDATGRLVATTVQSLSLESLYNVILLNQNGSPLLKIIELDPTKFLGNTDLLGGLGLGNLTSGLPVLNFLNLSDLGNTTGLLGLDFLNGNGDIVSGLMAAPQSILTTAVFAAPLVLNQVSVIGSPLGLDGTLNELVGQDLIGGVFGLGNVSGLTGVTGIVTGLVPTVTNLLNGLLGGLLGNTNPLRGFGALQKNVANTQAFEPGHKYTMLMYGDKSNLKTLVIDQTKLGLN